MHKSKASIYSILGIVLQSILTAGAWADTKAADCYHGREVYVGMFVQCPWGQSKQRAGGLCHV